MLGFTLAEVLITLVIIGVIAAITVPSLINKTNNQEYVSRLKKAYSTLAQATNKIIAEEGTPQANVGGWSSSADDIYNIYKKYLLNAKECDSDSGCFVQGAYKLLDNQPTGNWDTNTAYRKLVLTDGTQIMFENWISPDCSQERNGSRDWCARIFVDINGAKKPNIVGRDVFGFVIKKQGLYPIGCDSDFCVGTTGWGCACKVLREGAINY